MALGNDGLMEFELQLQGSAAREAPCRIESDCGGATGREHSISHYECPCPVRGG